MTNAEARFNKIHIRKVYACLAVTCHLHFLAEWPGFFTCYCGNTGVERYRNKSQHRKSTLEKKILPPFQQGFEPATFQSRVRCSNHWAIPAPNSHTYLRFSPLYWHRQVLYFLSLYWHRQASMLLVFILTQTNQMQRTHLANSVCRKRNREN